MPQGRADAPAGGRVPEPRRALLAAGHDRLAVAAVIHHLDRPSMPEGLTDASAGGHVPHLRRSAVAPAHEGLAAPSEGQGADVAPVFHWNGDGLPRGGVPKPYLAV